MDYFYVSSLCQLARYLWLVRLGGWKWNILYGLWLVLCFTFSLPILQYRFDKTEIPTYWKRYVLHWLYSSCEGKGLQLISLDKLEKEWSSAWSKAFHKARREISVLMQPLQYYSLVERVSPSVILMTFWSLNVDGSQTAAPQLGTSVIWASVR